MDRSLFVIGLVFAIPPGVGVWLATLRVTGGKAPRMAAAAGVLVGLGMFLAVIGLARWGRIDPELSDR